MPVIVLYFGDLDEGGEVISEVVERDVNTFCSVPFDFVRCGINEDQVAHYGVPENPDKPGQYQWEALPDAAAREIIHISMEPYVRHDALSVRDTEEDHAEQWLREQLEDVVERWPS